MDTYLIIQDMVSLSAGRELKGVKSINLNDDVMLIQTEGTIGSVRAKIASTVRAERPIYIFSVLPEYVKITSDEGLESFFPS